MLVQFPWKYCHKTKNPVSYRLIRGGIMKANVFRSIGTTVLFVSLISILFLSTGESQAGEFQMKAHIAWGWIHDFEFFEDGIFIAPYNGGIGYFDIDENFNLTYRYTIDPGGYHQLSQFCIADSNLFAADGSPMHLEGTPVFFSYAVSETGFEYLAGLEPSGTVWAEFAPIVYHNNSVIYHDCPSDYYRIDVSDPGNPFLSGTLLGATDVCHDILPYQDTLLITTMKKGTGFWDGNFRIINNIPPDPLTSIGTYGTTAYSYTSSTVNIGPILFSAHNQGLRVYDLSDLGNVPQIYFFPTAWGRCVCEDDSTVFMGCNDGWHFFEYMSSGDIEHVEYYSNDTRVLRMRLKPEAQELWCFVDAGSLGGLVVLDISGSTGIEDAGPCTDQISLRSSPNPFTVQTAITCSVPFDAPATLDIFDLTGRKVRTLLDKQQTAGGEIFVYWDGCNDTGTPLSDGVYLSRLVSGGLIETCRLTLIR